MSYEWMKSGLEDANDTAFRAVQMEPANKATFHGFLSQLEDALDIRGYFRPRERKEVMLANLRSVLRVLILANLRCVFYGELYLH